MSCRLCVCRTATRRTHHWPRSRFGFWLGCQVSCAIPKRPLHLLPLRALALDQTLHGSAGESKINWACEGRVNRCSSYTKQLDCQRCRKGRTPFACSLASPAPSSSPAAYISSLASTSQPFSCCNPCQQPQDPVNQIPRLQTQGVRSDTR